MDIECYHIKNKDLHVKGFLDYGTCSDLENTVRYNVYTVLEDNGIDDYDINYMYIYAHGSRVFGNPRKDSDIDFVLFYKGLIDEDSLFNIFANESIYIEHVKCDFNPISIDDCSDMEFYIQKHDIEYNNLNEEFDFNLALDDYEEQLNGPIVPKKDIIKNNNSTKGLLDFYDLFVDLGLPSGTLWCKYNLGVDPKKLDIAQDWVGNYYAWGELSPKETYNWSTYKFGDMVTRTKYNDDDFDKIEIGEADGLKNLLLEDDVVTQTYRDEHFHIPTYLQLDELLSYTTCAKKQNYKGIDGLNGFVFVSNINYNSIFIPCAGQMKENELKFFGDISCIWTNFAPFKESASTLMAEMNDFNGKLNPHYMYRYIGLQVRPVMTK